MAEADPKTQKVPDEDTTSSHGPHAPRRDKTPERNYPEFERRDAGVNPKDAPPPRGPVNIGVKGGAPDDAPTPRAPEGATSPRDSGGATDHPASGTQGSSRLPET